MNIDVKVKAEVFWEGHKIWKRSRTCFDIYSVTSKQVGDFLFIFQILWLPQNLFNFTRNH